jgi:hypothetical protein
MRARGNCHDAIGGIDLQPDMFEFVEVLDVPVPPDGVLDDARHARPEGDGALCRGRLSRFGEYSNADFAGQEWLVCGKANDRSDLFRQGEIAVSQRVRGGYPGIVWHHGLEVGSAAASVGAAAMEKLNSLKTVTTLVHFWGARGASQQQAVFEHDLLRRGLRLKYLGEQRSGGELAHFVDRLTDRGERRERDGRLHDAVIAQDR